MLDKIIIINKNFTKIILLIVLLSFINKKRVLIIDNIISESFYQNEEDFSKYDIKYKILAIYYPENFLNIIENVNTDFINFFNNKNGEINIKKSLIEYQILLAKNHGIYGFGIVYDITNISKNNEEIFNLFSYNNDNNFPFFIILKNVEKYYQQLINYLIVNFAANEEPNLAFIEEIKKYFISENYIKIRGKRILGIFNSTFSTKFIYYIKRNNFIKGRFHLYIISIFHQNNVHYEYLKNTYSFFEFPPGDIWLKNNLSKIYLYNYYYYHNLFIKEKKYKKYISTFPVINGCSPEKFYIIFKKYLHLSKYEKNKILLINSWNNYEENFYLEPNKEFGFSYLNYLSKALFNIDENILYDLQSLKNKCKIAIQIHLFYEDLIKDIINKTNNIPVKFDLYISIVIPENYQNIIHYIKQFSKANYFEILNVENKGRDVLPFLNQMKTKFKLYKYLCHLHTKKTKKVPEIGFLWRNYLFNNLLGNKKIISEILYDFENDEKLGFIFPEAFVGIIKFFYKETKENKKWMNFLVSKLFSNYKIDGKFIYPAGNMFWTKIQAIFQIFTFDLSEYFPDEKNQTDETIMHGIERIWLFLVKYNNYNYKMIFKLF